MTNASSSSSIERVLTCINQYTQKYGRYFSHADIDKPLTGLDLSFRGSDLFAFYLLLQPKKGHYKPLHRLDDFYTIRRIAEWLEREEICHDVEP